MTNKMMLALTLAVACGSGSECKAYGPRGHSMVGAIADQLLKSKPTAAKVAALLDGITLADAALIPDQIKAWDSKAPIIGHTFLRHHPGIEKEMIAFHTANPHNSPGNDHHAFHFTDVPVFGGELYAGGAVGRSNIDIVHMITFCIKVLTGEIPADNTRKITKSVAVILLAHLVGDIHQPLHVGAEYFDSAAHPVNPDTTPHAQADVGGNLIVLVLTGLSGHGHGHGAHNPSLHSFWDDAAVDHAMDDAEADFQNGHPHAHNVTDDDLAQTFAATDPGGLDGDAALDPHKLSEAWANEILPAAREAHERLDFAKISVDSPNASAAAVAASHGPKWMATEKSSGTYADFAGKTVGLEIQKGGWRLAALLDRIVQ